MSPQQLSHEENGALNSLDNVLLPLHSGSDERKLDLKTLYASAPLVSSIFLETTDLFTVGIFLLGVFLSLLSVIHPKPRLTTSLINSFLDREFFSFAKRQIVLSDQLLMSAEITGEETNMATANNIMTFKK